MKTKAVNANARLKITSAVAALALLTSCAGRSPNPVAVSQPQDNGTSCAALRAEMAANTEKIDSLGTEQESRSTKNIGAGVAGLLIWPLWFAMDFKDAAGTEKEALQQRNAYLGVVAAERCDTIPEAAPAASAN